MMIIFIYMPMHVLTVQGVANIDQPILAKLYYSLGLCLTIISTACVLFSRRQVTHFFVIQDKYPTDYVPNNYFRL